MKMFGIHAKEMEMIAHQGIGIKMEGIAILVFGKVGEAGFIIPCVEEDILPLVAAGQDVVRGVWKINRGLWRHEHFLAKKTPQVNTLLSWPPIWPT